MAKRGENIRKRKDGRWEGRFIKGRKPDRTAIWGYIYGRSYTEVKEKLTTKKMEVQQFALNADNPTFSELSLTWESSIFYAHSCWEWKQNEMNRIYEKSCTLMSPRKTELGTTTGAVNTPRKKKVSSSIL